MADWTRQAREALQPGPRGARHHPRHRGLRAARAGRAHGRHGDRPRRHDRRRRARASGDGAGAGDPRARAGKLARPGLSAGAAARPMLRRAGPAAGRASGRACPMAKARSRSPCPIASSAGRSPAKARARAAAREARSPRPARASSSPSKPTRLPVYLFGAGHVGRAIAARAAGLPLHLAWYDSRPEMAETPGVVLADEAAMVACAAAAPEGAAVVILTHDHGARLSPHRRRARRPRALRRADRLADQARPLPLAPRGRRRRRRAPDLPDRPARHQRPGARSDRHRHARATAHAEEPGMKAFRGEILSVPDDPAVAGADAIRHFEDGLLVVEDGLVLACGPHADLAERFADVRGRTARRPDRPRLRRRPCPLSADRVHRLARRAAHAMARTPYLPGREGLRRPRPCRFGGRLLPRRAAPPRHHQRARLRHRPRRLGRRLVRGRARSATCGSSPARC